MRRPQHQHQHSQPFIQPSGAAVSSLFSHRWLFDIQNLRTLVQEPLRLVCYSLALKHTARPPQGRKPDALPTLSRTRSLAPTQLTPQYQDQRCDFFLCPCQAVSYIRDHNVEDNFPSAPLAIQLACTYWAAYQHALYGVDSSSALLLTLTGNRSPQSVAETFPQPAT